MKCRGVIVCEFLSTGSIDRCHIKSRFQDSIVYESVNKDDKVIILSSNDDNDFIELFLERRIWWTNSTVARSQWDDIRFLAIYRADPVHGITHYARVERVYRPIPKYTHFVLGTAIAHGWIGYVPGAKVRGIKYVSIEKLLQAEDYDDLWSGANSS